MEPNIDASNNNPVKRCVYCNEQMVYGVQIQTMCNFKLKYKVPYVKYEQLGWTCNMRDDNCDVIFDDNNTGINLKNYNDAVEKLNQISRYIEN